MIIIELVEGGRAGMLDRGNRIYPITQISNEFHWGWTYLRWFMNNRMSVKDNSFRVRLFNNHFIHRIYHYEKR